MGIKKIVLRLQGQDCPERVGRPSTPEGGHLRESNLDLRVHPVAVGYRVRLLHQPPVRRSTLHHLSMSHFLFLFLVSLFSFPLRTPKFSSTLPSFLEAFELSRGYPNSSFVF